MVESVSLRKFGHTGWHVSSLSMGTVELGVRYGLYAAGETLVPSPEDAVALLLRGFEQGINLVDTAPAYGDSEELVGRALKEWGERVYVATKVDNNQGLKGRALADSLNRQIDLSRHALGTDCLDLVQIHNGKKSDFDDSVFLEVLTRARKAGKLRHIGTSVYGEKDAMGAVACADISAVQIAYNLLDQRMGQGVIEKARQNGVAVMVRSALLKGVLAGRQDLLPPRLDALREGADRAAQWCDTQGMSRVAGALAFCQGSVTHGTVLVGVRNRQELDVALETVGAQLSDAVLEQARELALDGDVVDPRYWDLG